MSNKPKQILIEIQNKDVSLKINFKDVIAYSYKGERWKIFADDGTVEMWVCKNNINKLKDKKMFIKCVDKQTGTLIPSWPKGE